MKTALLLLLLFASCTTKEPEVQTEMDSINLDFKPGAVYFIHNDSSMVVTMDTTKRFKTIVEALKQAAKPDYIIKQFVMDLGKNQFVLITQIRKDTSGVWSSDMIWEQHLFQTDPPATEIQKTGDYREALGRHCIYWIVPKLTDAIIKDQYSAAEVFLANYSETMKQP